MTGPVTGPGTGLRVLEGMLLALVGAGLALAGVVSHELWWGLPLTAATLVACFVWVGRGWFTRLPMAAGFVAIVLVALPTRSEGDFLVSSSARGSLFLLLTLVVVVAALVTLPRPRRVPAPDPVGETT